MRYRGTVHERRGRLATGREDLVRVVVLVDDPQGRPRWASFDMSDRESNRYAVGKKVTVTLTSVYNRG